LSLIYTNYFLGLFSGACNFKNIVPIVNKPITI